MTFSASSAELLKALTVVGGVVPSKSTLPILECILFEGEGDQLKLSATDLEISIVKRVPVRFETGNSSELRIAVPARRLLETLRALPDLPVRFTADDEFHVELRTDQGVYRMVGSDGADYPALPSVENETQIRADGDLLTRAIEKTSFAVSKDALRPAMMGVYFQVKRDHTRAVATDGHRLVKLSLSGISHTEPINFILPEKALSLAARAVDGEDCTLSVGAGYSGIEIGDTLILARMIDEPYPNYEAVIPFENDRRMTVNRSAMLAAARRVALYSSSITHQIRLKLGTNEVVVSAEDIERSSEARETVLCEYDNEEMEIGFNAVYLIEVLNNIDAEEVHFDLSTPNRAGVVTPAEQSEGEELLMLIMPVMLNTYA